jgi:hypothetical protein
MDWTIKPYSQANHRPVIEVNGSVGTAPVYLDAKVGESVTLDASHTQDPDKQQLQYRWFHYAEAGGTGASLAAVSISGADTDKAIVTPTATCRAAWLDLKKSCPPDGVAHIILAVSDNGSPRLTSYRRVVLTVHGATQ